MGGGVFRGGWQGKRSSLFVVQTQTTESHSSAQYTDNKRPSLYQLPLGTPPPLPLSLGQQEKSCSKEGTHTHTHKRLFLSVCTPLLYRKLSSDPRLITAPPPPLSLSLFLCLSGGADVHPTQTERTTLSAKLGLSCLLGYDSVICRALVRLTVVES